jgi:hypothetical protein
VDWGEPYYYLGMIYLQEGKKSQALEALRWAERTLDEGELLLKTRQTIQQLAP